MKKRGCKVCWLLAIFMSSLIMAMTAQPASATDADQVAANFAAMISAYNKKNVTLFMSYVSSSYLDSGETFAALQSDIQSQINGSFQPYTCSTPVVNVNGTSATSTSTCSGDGGPDNTVWRKESDSVWRMYGNQQKYDYSAESQHWPGGTGSCGWSTAGYYVSLDVWDPGHAISSASATGPYLSGSVSLTYQNSDWYANFTDNPPYLGSALPTTYPTYTFTVHDAGGTSTTQKTITGYVQDFATNLTPSGSAGGTVSFGWTGITGATQYRVDVMDNSCNNVWSSDNISPNVSNTYTVAYGGPALTAGRTYNYQVSSQVKTNGSKNVSFSTGSFFYTGSGGAKISVSGTTYDLNNAPVSGATVQMVGNANVTTTTASNGTFTLSGLPSGTPFQVQVTKTGYEKIYSFYIEVTANITNAFWVLLPANWSTSMGNTAGMGIIIGRVEDAANMQNDFISGATVTAKNSQGQTLPVVYQVNPDGGLSTFLDGKFFVKNVSPGETVTVTATKAGISFVTMTFGAYADGISEGGVWGSPSPSATVWYTGVVKNPVAGGPIAGATVQLVSDATKSTTTNTDGSFTLAGIPQNTAIEFKVTKSSYATTYIPFKTSTSSTYSWNVFFPLYTPAQLTTWGYTAGKGLMSGRASYTTTGQYNVSGVAITAAGSPSGKTYPVLYQDKPTDTPAQGTATPASGRFWVFNVAAGDTVTINGSRSGFTFSPVTVTPPDDGGVTGFKILGTAAAYISGYVKDATTGAAVSNALVALTDSSNNPAGSVYSASDGTFYLGVGAAGKYSITASMSGYQASSPESVSPTAGQTLNAGSLLIKKIPSASLSLVSGWNLVSLSVQPTNTGIASVLSGIGGSYQVVWGYAGQSWKVYDPSDAEGSTLKTMEAGKGYWLKMTSAKTLTVPGSPAPAYLSLLKGWNLVGYNGGSCTAPASALTGIAGSVQISWGYPAQAWKVYDPSDAEGSTLAQFCSGSGYWLKVNQAETWTLPAP